MISIKTKHVFVFLVLLGSFLRLYRLRETMQFLGDQGRDALIVRRMLIEHHPALIGPVTSVGNMYLGPLYYYFMLFPLMLTYPDPTGPAIAVALVGIATLVLLYKLGKEILGEKAALLATALYAISPLVITYVRFSWNPNIVPFFSLLFFYHIYKTIKGSARAWIFVGLWFSILIQLHYITLILGAFAGLAWIYVLVTNLRKNKLHKDFFISTLIAIVVFLVSLTPLIIFDIRHGYVNSQAFMAFFQGGDQHFRTASTLKGVSLAALNIFVRSLVSVFSLTLQGFVKLAFFLFTLGTCVWIATRRGRHYQTGELLLFSLFSFACFCLALYRSSLYDHYLVFLFPLGALLLGVVGAWFWERMLLRPLVVGFIIVVITLSIQNYPGKQNLGYNVDMMKRTADQIQTHLKPGEKYNIFLFSPSNDFQGMNYRYFLTTGRQAPEREDEFFNFPTLFVIDDLRDTNIKTSNHYQLVVWPNRNVTSKFEIPGGPSVSILKR